MPLFFSFTTSCVFQIIVFSTKHLFNFLSLNRTLLSKSNNHLNKAWNKGKFITITQQVPEHCFVGHLQKHMDSLDFNNYSKGHFWGIQWPITTSDHYFQSLLVLKGYVSSYKGMGLLVNDGNVRKLQPIVQPEIG